MTTKPKKEKERIKKHKISTYDLLKQRHEEMGKAFWKYVWGRELRRIEEMFKSTPNGAKRKEHYDYNNM